MKKLFKFKWLLLSFVLSIVGISQTWASTSVTFYLALDASKTRNNNNCCAVQARIKWGGGGDNDNWSNWMNMTKTGNTYDGKLVYSQAFTFNNDGWHCWEFRMTENNNEHWYKSIHCGDWQTDCHNGDVYVYEESKWVKSPSWDDSYTVYFVNYGSWAPVHAYAWNNECDFNASHPGSAMTNTGMQYDGHDIYKITLNKRYGYIQFNNNSSGSKTGDLECYSNAGKMYTGSSWITPTATSGYTFSNGATVVWDNGARTDVLGEVHMYYEDWEGDHDIQLTSIGNKQHYYTSSNVIKGKSWIMRGANAWGYGQTTDITQNISNVTLFQYDGSADSNSKVNWQVTHNAKKATSGVKIYMDNSDAKWSAIWLKYGTQWFNRSSASAATKVTGTDNLYVITIPNDAYYEKYYLADNVGYVNYNDVENEGGDSYLIGNRISSVADNLSSDITYIPSTGSGTPKVWSASTMSGHTHDVTISAPSHGTITVAYTNESGTAQSPTSGTFPVARTCSLTVSSSAATGYKPETLTIDGNDHTSGGLYIIKKDITVAATFVAKVCDITFDKNGGNKGNDGTTATYDADMTTVTVPSRSGYTFDGYYDGETDGNGSGTKYYNANGTSAKAWDKDTESETTLYAKWTEITHTVSFANDGHGTTSPSTDQTVGEDAGVAISASNSTGYHFNTWTITSGSGTFTSAATTASNTFKPTSDATLTASFTANVYDGTINKTTGTGDDGSYSVTYGEKTISATNPTKSGYHVSGYYLSYNSSTKEFDNKIADKDGNLEADKSIGMNVYTNSSNEWIYDDDAPTIYAKWEGNSHTLKLYKNDGTEDYASTSVTVGSNSYTIEKPTRAGYDFDGFYTASTGGTEVVHSDLSKVNGDYFDASSNWKYDGNVDLYAHWTPVALDFVGTTNDDWNTATNWSSSVDGVDPCVPTSEHDVTISAEATISGGSGVAKSVAFGDDGKLTITSTGALEVAGTITNSDDTKLVVKPRGALIYSGSTSATVELSLTDGWHLIAIPVWAVDVSRAFQGATVFTYVWDNSEKTWERRGYYDGLGGFEPVLVYGSSGYNFSGTLVGSSNRNLGVNYDNTKASGDVSMFGNSWTAPIKISDGMFSGNVEHAVHFLNSGGSWTGAISSDVIPAMQGFAVLSTETGGGTMSINYDRDVRNATTPNAPLYAPKRNTSNIYDHITIYVSGNEWQHRIRLYENEQFTNDIDDGFEAVHMEGEGIVGELYVQAAEKMNILAVPNLEGTVVGFIPGEATNYTISFEGDGRGYYLNDNVTNQSTLIAEDNTYMFTPSANDAARFIVSRTPIQNMPTSVDNINDGAKARKQMIDGILYIIRDGQLFDARGNRVK